MAEAISSIMAMATIIEAILDTIWAEGASVEIKARISITRTKVSSLVTRDLLCRTLWAKEATMDLDSSKEMIALRINSLASETIMVA